MIQENGRGDERITAEVLLRKWKNASHIILLVAFSDIFSQIAPLSHAFQTAKTDLASTIRLAEEHTELLMKK